MEKRIYNDGKLRIKMKMNLCVLCNFMARSALVLRPERVFLYHFFVTFSFLFLLAENSFASQDNFRSHDGAPSSQIPPQRPELHKRIFRFAFKSFYASHLNPHKFFIVCNQRRAVECSAEHLGEINLRLNAFHLENQVDCCCDLYV